MSVLLLCCVTHACAAGADAVLPIDLTFHYTSFRYFDNSYDLSAIRINKLPELIQSVNCMIKFISKNYILRTL